MVFEDSNALTMSHVNAPLVAPPSLEEAQVVESEPPSKKARTDSSEATACPMMPAVGCPPDVREGMYYVAMGHGPWVF